MSEEAKRQEEREFQLQMLEAQISCDTANSISSVIIAVSYSLGISLYAIARSNIPDPLGSNLYVLSLISIMTGVFVTIVLFVFHYCSMPSKIQKIRDGFIKPLAHETTKKSVMVTLDKALLKWLEDEIEKKEFGSISHAIEKTLVKLKQEYETRT
jgi:hypothetical protein